MSLNKMKCTICDREFSEDDPGVAMPFCSKRCKTIDAARWLDEKYGLPYESEDIPIRMSDKNDFDTNSN